MSSERDPGDFGAKLRRAREHRGMPLRQIAAATKIPIGTLEALERSEWSRLPAGIFSRAFVRAYAREVGLDPEETVAEFVEHFPPDSITAGRSASTERDEHQAVEADQRIAFTTVRLVALSVPIAALLLYIGSRGVREPDRLPVSLPERSATGTSAEAGADGGAGERSDGVPVATSDRSPSTPSGVPVPLTVAVEATGPCWISARVDGERALVRELRAGERHVFEARSEVEMKIGDPAALRVSLNGADTRPLGLPARPVTRRFTPGNIQEYLPRP